MLCLLNPEHIWDAGSSEQSFVFLQQSINLDQQMSSEPQYLCSTSLKEGEKQPLSNCDTHCYQHFNNITTEYKSSVTTVIQIIMQHSGDITCERVSWEQRTSVCFWRDGAERTAPSVWRTYFKRIESNWSCDKGSAGWILGRGSSQKGWSGLPKEVVMATSLTEFKMHLDKALGHMVWFLCGPLWSLELDT